jgi:aminoglycoside 6-adenylyltransferase
MRSEQEMLGLILSTAQADERIRAVMLNGSRANPSAPRDIFQDFDIVYLVRELESFKSDPNWIDRFGELMVMQIPGNFEDLPPDVHVYLLQLADGNRIDLTLKTGSFESDSQSILLLDKDGTTASLPEPSDTDYLPKPPTAKAFFNHCNEFWWVCPYVAKGLWREEITYAKAMMEVLRDQLMQMLVWHIGIRTDFKKSPGKNGKYLQKYLRATHWEGLLKTYAAASYEQNWEALLAMTELFREVAGEVAAYFGFEYPGQDDKRVSEHLRHVRQLPKDAPSIY